MKFYPVNINIQNKKCVVVGGGKIACDKIIGLLEAGAQIDVIAPKICNEIEKLSDKIKIIRENYSAEKLSEGVILVAATNNSELNAQIAQDGRTKHFLVNIVDDISSDFIVPSRIRRGDFLLAISTGGSSPAFSKFVRKMLEQELDENFGAAVEIISKYRQTVIKKFPTHELRIQFWQEVLTVEVWENIKSGELSKLEDKIKNALTKKIFEPNEPAAMVKFFEEHKNLRVRQAFEISKWAHTGQVDKAGVDYILHPMTVALNCGENISAAVVALLHDVIEDTNLTFDDLQQKISLTAEELQALKLLTHKKNIPYAEYIQNIKQNVLATTVKIADLEHNSNLSRLPTITEKDLKRAEKYRQSLQFLKSEITSD